MKAFRCEIRMLAVITAIFLSVPTSFAEELHFGPPVKLGIMGSNPELSDDGLIMYYAFNYEIWYVTRNTLKSPWSAPAIIPLAIQHNSDPSISSDGLILYFASEDPITDWDIWKVTRADINSSWSAPINLGSPVNSLGGEGAPDISPDGNTLYFNYVNGTSDIWYAQRIDESFPWEAPQLLAEVSSPAWQGDPSISNDGLILVFSSGRLSGYGGMDIWYSTRASINDPWDPPKNAGPIVNTSADEAHPGISLADHKLYFDRRGELYLYSSKIIFGPISEEVDLILTSGSGGTTDPSPGTYTYEKGTEITITAIPDAGYRFSHWSGDSSSLSNPITITMNSDKSITANFVRQYTLTLASGSGGTTDPVPGTYLYDEGTEVTITAIPDAHYRFSHWSGVGLGNANFNARKLVNDSGINAVKTIRFQSHHRFNKIRNNFSSADNPIAITMDSDKSITAFFSRIIYPPLNFSGQKVLNRSLSQAEYINVLTWQANPNNVHIEKYRIYLKEGETESLLVELDANTYQYWHRRVEKDKQYTYAICAVDDEGWEGDQSIVTVPCY